VLVRRYPVTCWASPTGQRPSSAELAFRFNHWFWQPLGQEPLGKQPVTVLTEAQCLTELGNLKAVTSQLLLIHRDCYQRILH
jgi:hypothetical protein